MTARLLDGKTLAEEIRQELAVETAAFVRSSGVTPKLSVVLAGDDPASAVYVRAKQRDAKKVGMASELHRLAATTTQDELLDLIARLNADPIVHGILVQLPVPKQIDAQAVLEAISPDKDVDAFHPQNVGRIVQGNPRFLPCTPAGVREILVRNGIEIGGKHVVVVGRSDIVGKPLANMLVQRGPGGDATVTICHSRTADLPAVTRLADILVVAIGQPRFVTADMVRPGAVVVDVGINRIDEGLVGDVDFAGVAEVASYITPAPGGVGQLTPVMLLANTLKAAKQACGGK